MSLVEHNPLDIIVGDARTLTFHIPADDPQPIIKSEYDSDDEVTIFTVPQHGYTNGQLVRIYDHENNYGGASNLNGIQTITVINANTFSVAEESNGTGKKSGYVFTPMNFTGKTLEGQIRYEPEEDSTLCFEYTTIASSPLTYGEIVLEMEDTDTEGAEFLARIGQTVYEVVKVDGTEVLRNVAKVIGRVVQEVAP